MLLYSPTVMLYKYWKQDIEILIFILESLYLWRLCSQGVITSTRRYDNISLNLKLRKASVDFGPLLNGTKAKKITVLVGMIDTNYF